MVRSIRRLPLWLAGLAWPWLQAAAQLPRTVIVDDTVPSAVLGERRLVRIALPKDYDRGDRRYHVVYALDGNASVEYTIGIAETLYQSGFPRLIVVAVPSTHRSRDLSPTEAPDTPSGGGADAFLAFLEQELAPHVDGRYRTTGFRVLAGHSLGGLFAVHALARSASFDAYIAISPSVFLNGDDALARLRRAFADGRVSGTLFVAMGFEPGEEGDGILRLREVLERDAPGTLRWTFRAYDEESHSSVPVVATMDGLRYVFGGYVLPDSVRRRGVAAIAAHYDGLRDRYRVTVPVPQRVLADEGFDRLTRADTAGAVEVFEYYTAVYPDMVLPLHALAEIARAGGRDCDALAYVRRMLALAPGSLDAQRLRDALAPACRE